MVPQSFKVSILPVFNQEKAHHTLASGLSAPEGLGPLRFRRPLPGHVARRLCLGVRKIFTLPFALIDSVDCFCLVDGFII